jgi:prepilin-type processing-associated H-X9-DG protein
LPVYWDHDIYSPLVKGSGYGYPHYSLYQYGWANGETRSLKHTASGPAANHGKNINYLFADGHAASMGLWPYADTLSDPEPADYYFEYFHPTRNLNTKPY